MLGTHVEQAGQLVDSRRMRFDFTHFSALTGEELRAVEDLVNQWILDGMKADIREMPIDEARRLGAMALFGRKIRRCGTRGADGGCLHGALWWNPCGQYVQAGGCSISCRNPLSPPACGGSRRVTGGNVVDWIRGHQALLAENSGDSEGRSAEEVPEKAAS